ncbi:DUF4198 domain-containing protein [Maritimibacter sp. DP1N21-5]|uniref:DUF4198 domain-containing protein n=1 Tax=Maritimibacter sp. DP1N21-5 TaxID=2836867 RepID=UPI001C48CF71|nr:DUF4198 domain-containing protein [Maritimibacter sp. DP1N21-5]MBV7410837.1 DUF4198 domain-containing protein [Maritimibacter sp. DP1N21-5]
MRFATILLTCLCLARVAHAHEFWIAPRDYTVATGDAIIADLRVGQDFRGAAQSYFPGKFARFEVRMGDRTAPVEGRIGDIPALDMPAPQEGLAIVIHETANHDLTYRERELFERFVAHKDLGDVLERHAQRGLPELAFREAYTRYAKSLVAVGDGAGTDLAVGLHHEIVAGLNPFTDDLSGGMPVQVLYDGAPRAEAQVEVFARGPSGEITQSFYRTDETGLAVIPMAPSTEYMVDAVVMEDTGNDDPDAGPVWHSAWANLTFSTP